MIKHYIIFLIGVSLSILGVPTVNAEPIEVICERNGGEWTGTECDFDPDDEDKVDQFHSELMSIENYNYAKSSCPNYGDGKWNANEMICETDDPEEMAAYEDHICDEPNANKEFPTICDR